MQSLYRQALTLKVLLPAAGALVSVAIPILLTLAMQPSEAITERRIGLFVFVAPFGYALGSGAYFWYRTFALPQQLGRSGIACLQCGYPLRPLPRTGHCPECGVRYERGAIVEIWRQIIRGRI